MVLPVKLKFSICIIEPIFVYYINFGLDRRYSFFTGYTKLFLLIMVYRLKIFEMHYNIVKFLNYVLNKSVL